MQVGWVLGVLDMWVVDVWTVRQLVDGMNDCLVLEVAVVGRIDGKECYDYI